METFFLVVAVVSNVHPQLLESTPYLVCLLPLVTMATKAIPLTPPFRIQTLRPIRRTEVMIVAHLINTLMIELMTSLRMAPGRQESLFLTSPKRRCINTINNMALPRTYSRILHPHHLQAGTTTTPIRQRYIITRHHRPSPVVKTPMSTLHTHRMVDRVHRIILPAAFLCTVAVVRRDQAGRGRFVACLPPIESDIVLTDTHMATRQEAMLPLPLLEPCTVLSKLDLEWDTVGLRV
jgi:hypothetical protein